MRTRKSPMERQEEILNCAERLLVAQGYENVQVSHIMQAANISRGGFYHHFDSKQAILQKLIQIEVAQLAAKTGAQEQGEPVRYIINLLASGSSYLDGSSGILDTIKNPENITLYLHYLEQAQHAYLKPHLIVSLKQGMAKGIFNSVPPEHVADLFLAVNSHINAHVITGQWSNEDAKAFSTTALQALELLLGVPGHFSATRDAMLSPIKQDHNP